MVHDGEPLTAARAVKTARPSMIVAVILRIQVIGISFRLLAPTLTTTVATAHRPSAAPANTSNGSYLAAGLAVASWVMSPHSATNTTPKLAPATRGNDGTQPPWRAASTPARCPGRKLDAHRQADPARNRQATTMPVTRCGSRASNRPAVTAMAMWTANAAARSRRPGQGKLLRPDVLNSRRSRPPRAAARRPGASARRYVGQPAKDYSPSEPRISGFHPPGPVNAARSWQMWVFAVMPPAAWPRLEIEGGGEGDSGAAADGVTSTTGGAVGFFVFFAALGSKVSCWIALNNSSACGCLNSTSLGFGGQRTLGAVMNCTEPMVTPRRLSAICSIVFWSRPVSVAIAPVASPTIFSILVGLLSRPLCTMPCTSAAIRYWSRVIRSRSEPSPRSSRVRQNASASCPKTWCTPADKLRPDSGSS